jgi:IS30 family transposase
MLVERKTRLTLILKLAGKDCSSDNHSLVKAFAKMPSKMKQTLIVGREFVLAKHVEFSDSIGIPLYPCDPQTPAKEVGTKLLSLKNKLSSTLPNQTK